MASWLQKKAAAVAEKAQLAAKEAAAAALDAQAAIQRQAQELQTNAATLAQNVFEQQLAWGQDCLFPEGPLGFELEGPCVTAVDPDGMATQLGVKVGDTMIAIAGEPIPAPPSTDTPTQADSRVKRLIRKRIQEQSRPVSLAFKFPKARKLFSPLHKALEAKVADQVSADHVDRERLATEVEIAQEVPLDNKVQVAIAQESEALVLSGLESELEGVEKEAEADEAHEAIQIDAYREEAERQRRIAMVDVHNEHRTGQKQGPQLADSIGEQEWGIEDDLVFDLESVNDLAKEVVTEAETLAISAVAIVSGEDEVGEEIAPKVTDMCLLEESLDFANCSLGNVAVVGDSPRFAEVGLDFTESQNEELEARPEEAIRVAATAAIKEVEDIVSARGWGVDDDLVELTKEVGFEIGVGATAADEALEIEQLEAYKNVAVEEWPLLGEVAADRNETLDAFKIEVDPREAETHCRAVVADACYEHREGQGQGTQPEDATCEQNWGIEDDMIFDLESVTDLAKEVVIEAETFAISAAEKDEVGEDVTTQVRDTSLLDGSFDFAKCSSGNVAVVGDSPRFGEVTADLTEAKNEELEAERGKALRVAEGESLKKAEEIVIAQAWAADEGLLELTKEFGFETGIGAADGALVEIEYVEADKKVAVENWALADRNETERELRAMASEGLLVQNVEVAREEILCPNNASDLHCQRNDEARNTHRARVVADMVMEGSGVDDMRFEPRCVDEQNDKSKYEAKEPQRVARSAMNIADWPQDGDCRNEAPVEIEVLQMDSSEDALQAFANEPNQTIEVEIKTDGQTCETEAAQHLVGHQFRAGEDEDLQFEDAYRKKTEAVKAVGDPLSVVIVSGSARVWDGMCEEKLLVAEEKLVGGAAPSVAMLGQLVEELGQERALVSKERARAESSLEEFSNCRAELSRRLSTEEALQAEIQSLQSELKTKCDTMDQLREDLEVAMMEGRGLSEALLESRGEYGDASAQHAQEQRRVYELMERFSHLDASSTRQREALQRAEDESASVSSANKELCERLAQLGDFCERQELTSTAATQRSVAEAESLHALAAEQQQEVASLGVALKSITNKAEGSAMQAHAMEAELAAARKLILAEEGTLVTVRNSELHYESRSLESIQNAIDLEVGLGRARSEIRAAAEQKRRCTSELDAYRAECREFSSSTILRDDHFSAAQSLLESRLYSLQNQVESLRAGFESAQQEATEHQTLRSAAEVRCEALQAAIAQAEVDWETADRAREGDFEKVLARVRRQEANLAERLAQADAAAAERLECAHRDAEAALGDAGRDAATIAALVAQLKAAQTHSAEVENELNVAKGMLVVLTGEAESVEAKVESHRVLIHALQQRIGEQEQDRTRLELKLAEVPLVPIPPLPAAAISGSASVAAVRDLLLKDMPSDGEENASVPTPMHHTGAPEKAGNEEATTLYETIAHLEKRCRSLQRKLDQRPIIYQAPKSGGVGPLGLEAGELVRRRADQATWLEDGLAPMARWVGFGQGSEHRLAELCVSVTALVAVPLRTLTQSLLRRDAWLFVFYAHVLVLYILVASCWATGGGSTSNALPADSLKANLHSVALTVAAPPVPH